MQTLAAGSPRGPQACELHALGAASRGFTLLELLVVVAIIAIASAGVALTLRDNTASDLERDAQRLAAVLESARAQSRMQGTPVRWRPTVGGFVLDGLNPPLPPQTWLSNDTTVAAVLRKPGTAPEPGNAPAALTLGPEPILEAQAVVLMARSQDSVRLQLATDGLRPFAIVPLGSPIGAIQTP